MLPVFNKFSQKWVIVLGNRLQFYDYYEDALAAIMEPGLAH